MCHKTYVSMKHTIPMPQDSELASTGLYIGCDRVSTSAAIWVSISAAIWVSISTVIGSLYRLRLVSISTAIRSLYIGCC